MSPIIELMTMSTYHRVPLADDIVDCYFCNVGCFQFRMMHSDAESSFKLILLYLGLFDILNLHLDIT